MKKKILLIGLLVFLIALAGCINDLQSSDKNVTSDTNVLVSCNGYALGETWQALDGCNTCNCNETGISCTEIACMPKNFCETAFECESKDLAHADCVGNWHCISNRCKWECTQEEPPEDGQESSDENETEQEDDDIVEDETEDSCASVNCPNKCVENVLLYNGKCENAQCTYSEIECEHGCENAQCIGDPCLGMACSDTCDGTTRKYNGGCVEGTCQYSSNGCEFGCSNGNCNADPCLGIACENYCADGVVYSEGSCENSQCKYAIEKICAKDCEGNACMEYYCGWTWPQKITNKSTAEVLWECPLQVGTNIGPWCGAQELETPVCCETSAHDNCSECTEENCITADCIGVSCPNTCDGTTRKYNGNCVSGECTYETEVCNRGCSGGTCIILPVGTIFTSSTRHTANLGGITGADSICQSLADNAGLSGTWKALISDSSTNAKDRIPDTTYKRVDGAVIANNKADLFDSSIQNKINLDESSVLHEDVGQASYVWTGSKTDGTVFTGGYQGVTNVTNCDNWTFEEHEYQTRGVAGYVRDTDRRWIDAHLTSNVSYCNNEQRLYCVKTSS